MMNNQYSSGNISSQNGIQMAHHVTASPPQPPAAVINTFVSAQQQQQQHLAAAVAAGALYADPRQLRLNSTNLDKSYYTTTGGTLGSLGTSQRFYTTASPAAAGGTTNTTVAVTGAHHPNTILITNNFAQQQAAQALSPDQQRNIRIVASSPNTLNSTNIGNMATAASGFQHSQHVFNMNTNKQLQHLFPQHLLQQQNFAPPTTDLLQTHYASQQFPPSQQHQNHSVTPAIQMPQFYVSSENSIAPLSSNTKIIANIPSNSVASTGNCTTSLIGASSNANSNSSTVVLDRINICINNLYTDTSSSSSASNSLSSTPAQQPSPIIPAIQHKPIIENGPTLPMVDVYEANVLVIDEPDSTTTATTPHTPPTTPENTSPMPNIGNINNNNSNNNISTSSLNSPCTSYNHQQVEKSTIIASKQSFASAAHNIENALQDSSNKKGLKITENTSPISQSANIVEQQNHQHLQTTRNISSNTPLTPPTPPSPKISNNNNDEYLFESKQVPKVPSVPLFSNGEDVFIKRHDGRFYLGTVIDTTRKQFLIRFDDQTEVWCDAEEMRKLGGSSNNNSSSSKENIAVQPMCVACKRSQPDSKVEICERCGRGYHRKCTTETSPGSEVWQCKRCAKPMKLDESSKLTLAEEEPEIENCLQLHYNVESLTWNDKHCMNEQQIYCYCGKSGKFDNNMLQCWRCLNWYHVHCTQKFKGNLLRGDSFFVFCCSVCNNGEEYLRRLQSNWKEMVHLILYNLSIMKKHHKYHHLVKDINPFVLEKRHKLPIPKQWISMSEKEFLDRIKSTLIGNSDLFLCGKEIKRDNNLFALRILEPPAVNKVNNKIEDIINDEFIFHNLKDRILLEAPENADFKFLNLNLMDIGNIPKSKRKLNEDSSSHDVYEFDDTSEDEIPIKHILDKVKKSKLTTSEAIHNEQPKTLNTISTTTILEKMDVADDNANDGLTNQVPEQQSEDMRILSTSQSEHKTSPKKEGKIISPLRKSSDSNKKCNEEILGEKLKVINVKHIEKSSRKRKAFTLSKSYNTTRLFDSSSDENSSSSSRGTSLDLIIPPPKNFLGQNNPFRIISPKKNTDTNNRIPSGKKSVSFGIFNTTALNFSSKLAALKSAGLFPKLSTSNLAKAAGQPRTVRTIKRRLSAKDITIGPNKEVRRRRTRRLSSNIEVISTTTINPIPGNFFPIQAKDLLAAAAASTTTAASLFTTTHTKTSSTTSLLTNNVRTSTSPSPNIESANIDNTAVPPATSSIPTHGRRLRQRPQKSSPNASRRSSVSSNQSSTSSASAAAVGATTLQSHEDLKQTVNKYFGIVNRIESGEQFSIRAKRQLANGQMQYLIEWGESQMSEVTASQNLNEEIKVNQCGQTSDTQPMKISTT